MKTKIYIENQAFKEPGDLEGGREVEVAGKCEPFLNSTPRQRFPVTGDTSL